MFYLRRRVIPEKSILYFFKLLTICFGAVVINAWKTIFDIAIVFLKIKIKNKKNFFSKLVEYLLQCYKNFSPLSIFHFKRNGYLIFLTSIFRSIQHTHTYHRLPLEPLAGLQYLQFQVLLNLVLILKSAKKSV